MEIEIKKCKIKNGMFLAYEYTQTIDGITNNMSNSSTAVIHEDLRSALDALVPHFAFSTEEITKKEMEKIIEKRNEEALQKITLKYAVSGISIGSNGEGVTIIGQKILETGKKVNFCSPFTKFDDGEYYYEQDLFDKVNEVKEEVLAYMDGKQAQSNQMDLFEGFEVEPEGTFEDNQESEEESGNESA